MSPVGPWRSRPIFISSTFRDMHAERDHLAQFVFPELEERLRQRRHDLAPIDLRWGVETVSVDEQRAKELLVLKVCLAEIDRSRPFFIGLLGDRYGWVPPVERVVAATREVSFETEVADKSITALEIEYGVLASPDQQQRSFFYFRDPLPYDEMEPHRAAWFSDEYAPHPNGRIAHARLQTLKAQIRERMPHRVRVYQAQWDSDTSKLAGLESFGRLVLEDLWQELDRETRPFLLAVPTTWQEQERAALDEFAHQRGRGFVGREALLDRLSQLATSPVQEAATWGVCVVGGPGAGKSALFAELWHRLRANDDLLLPTHSAGISRRSISVDALLRRWVGELAASLGADDPAAQITGSDELRQAFAAYLSQAAAAGRVVLLLDGLDLFEPSPAARHLTWLPGREVDFQDESAADRLLWPQNARLIATGQPGSPVDALAHRSGVEVLDLSPLGLGDARQIIHQVCARYHRSLHREVADALLARQLPTDAAPADARSEGAPAAGNPLWLHLAMEDLLLLDEDDFSRLGEFAGSAEDKLHGLLVATASGFPPKVQSLYGTLLQRTEEAYGQAWAREFANLLAVSRWGLRESDLRLLLPQRAGQPWDGLRFATLRRGFRGHLVQRGAHGQWDFAHAQAREAVMARNLADPDRRRATHLALADYLLALPEDDPMRQSEAMHHLISAGDRDRAAEYYGTELSAGEEEGATLAVAASILAGSEQEPNRGLAWATSLLDVTRHGLPVVRRLCQRYNAQLLDALQDHVPIAQQIGLISAVEQVLADIRTRQPHRVGPIRDLGTSYYRLGELYRQSGDLASARRHYERSLEAAGLICERMPDDDQAVRDCAGSQAALADLDAQAGDLKEARRRYELALESYHQIWQRNPEHALDARNTTTVLGRLSALNQELGELDAALETAEQAFGVAKVLYELLPKNYHAARDVAVSYERLGTLSHEQGDLDDARRYLEHALGLWRQLWAQFPDSLGAARDLWMGYNKLGWLYQQAGEAKRARSYFEQALSEAEALLHRMPGSTAAIRDLANTCNKLGVLLQEQGELEQARELLDRALGLAEELQQRMPGSAEAIQDLALSLRAMGLLHLQAGELAQAEGLLLRSMRLSGQLYRLRPDSIQAVRGLWLSCHKLAGLYEHQGKRNEALDAYQRALGLAKALHQRQPKRYQATEDLADSLNGLGLLYLKLGNLARAQECYTRSVTLREELFHQRPESPQAAQELVNALLGQAQVLGNQGQTRESQQILVRCREPLRLLHRAGRLEHPYLKNLYGQLG